MMEMKNFNLSVPITDAEKLLAKRGAIILRDTDGREWYTSQTLFSDDTYKVMYDEQGTVRSITKDVSTLFPVSFSVAEVKEIPEGVNINGGWTYFDGRVFPRQYSTSEMTTIADLEKQSKIEKANEYMNSRQWPGKAALGRLKGDEMAQYNRWLDYLDALDEVDTSLAPDINWPEPPGY
ncbi:TPA: tail fiber assembly protein [Salmonella enterica]|nr:tail fiber assembly protein [Salmonella enterica]HAV9262250.1 tail fiber assembly protein [Salmonella enterica]